HHDGMEAQPACARMPFVSSGMLCEAGDFAPTLSTVLAAEQRRRRHARIKHLRLAGPARFDVPDALQLQPGTFQKAGILFRRRPALAQVCRPNHFAPEPRIVRRGVNSAAARIVDRMIDLAPILERPVKCPLPAINAGEKKQSLFGSGKQQCLHGLRESKTFSTEPRSWKRKLKS